MEAKAGTLRFRPSGGERWKRGMPRGTAPRRSATATPCCGRGMRARPRRTAYACFSPEARFIFSSPSPPNPPSPSPSKTPWAGQMGPRTRPVRWGQFFPKSTEFGSIIPLLSLFSIPCKRQYQLLGPARSIGCNLLQLKVANVFSIPLLVPVIRLQGDSLRSAFMFMHLGRPFTATEKSLQRVFRGSSEGAGGSHRNILFERVAHALAD